MQDRTDNPDKQAKKRVNALVIALLVISGVIAALMTVLTIIVGISAFARPPVTEKEEYAALTEKYKYNAVELHDDIGNRYGSAFVYTRQNGELYLFTNYHITGDDVSAISARFYGRNSYEKQGLLELVGYSREYDVSLLKTSTFPENPYVDIRAAGVKASVKQGAKILCLGNNLGYGIQAQNGIISTPCLVTNPQKQNHDGEPAYTIAVIGACAPLNSGNSGAAVYDLDGFLVGMNTWKVTSNAAGEAVCDTCYLTPANVLHAMFEILVGGGTSGIVDFPAVTMQSGEGGTLYVQSIHANFKFKDYKLTVDRVDSTGTRSLQVGDVILSFGSVAVEPNNFALVVGELFHYNVWGVGEKLTLKVLRNGKEISVALDELKHIRKGMSR